MVQLRKMYGKRLKKQVWHRDGKTVLYDGRTGEPFDNRVTVGYHVYD